MSSFGEKKEKTFEEKVKERLGEFIRVNNPKYLDDVRSAQLAIESELRQEQERLQKYEEFQTPQKEYEVLDKNILSEVTDRNIKEILPVIDMFFPGTSNMVEDTPKHEIRGVLSITERERVRDELSKKGYEVVLEEKLSEMRKSGKYTALGAFAHAKHVLECELREEQEMLQRYGALAEYPSRERVFGNINNRLRQEIFINKYPENNNVKCVQIRIVTRKNNKERDFERY